MSLPALGQKTGENYRTVKKNKLKKKKKTQEKA